MPPDKNEKCNACGGYDFSINDGFKYCDRCGALFENFEELEEEEGGIQQTLGQGKVKIKKNDGEERKKRVAPVLPPKTQAMEEALDKRSDFLRLQAVRKEELALPNESTPDYLYRLALRLFSFTQILGKTGHILVKELNFDPRVQTTILATFQRYLAHCRVAFCHSEQCGSDEQLRFVAIMENLEYEEQEREEKRRKKLARRGKGAKVLSKSAAAWTLLTQGNITEHLDLASDAEEDDLEEDEEMNVNVSKTLEKLELTQESTMFGEETVDVNDTTMGFVRKVTTALSREALRRASQLILNLELLVAVLHSALLSSGYKNIFISDVVRWIREDRFRIPRRAVRLIRQSHPDRMKTGEIEHHTAVDFAEPFLRLPLYEIARTSIIFNQSLQLDDQLISQNFETLASRVADNLNLPVDLLSRVLLLESIIPCDVSPKLLKQVDVSMGYNCEQLAALSPKLYYNGFMSSFGRKERTLREADICDEVLLSTDTKLIAYFLLAFRLTFDLDHAECSDFVDDPNCENFDIDTWIHQLEMRIKCWQGHDMTMVLRESCPIPEMIINSPFGSNYSYHDTKGVPMVTRHRRLVGFQKCIPSEMSFNSTSTLPTVFDVRHNRFPVERRQIEAMMSPLKFQRVILRKEIEQDQKSFKNVDSQSEKTFFMDFTTFQSSVNARSFNEYFPLASRYSIYKRPDWIQNCTARKSKLGPRFGPYRFYLSNQACDDLLGVATSSFSRRFEFLLESLSLLIGEDPKAVYAAFVMLEMHLTAPEKMQSIRNDLLVSIPITIDCQKFRSSTHHVPFKCNILTEEPLHRIEDLRYFRISRAQSDQEELHSNAYLMDLRNHELHDSLSSEEAKRVQKKIEKTLILISTLITIQCNWRWDEKVPKKPKRKPWNRDDSSITIAATREAELKYVLDEELKDILDEKAVETQFMF
ncbi:hypothetical protein CRE_02821 [Caenorhabditis remanei]|uniref:TATA box-binding protein-associated factor RNA polymerase I subunit B n=1 Tax=Caenorhabditis remanei TaxID=31234 RepID=E3LX62_CAERE|nr:hypothetical protein CRE_02821 [Caenorhabditis remanei]